MVKQFRGFIRDTKARVIPLTITAMLIGVAISGFFLSFNPIEPVKADTPVGTEFVVWVSTDTHVPLGYQWWDAVNDSNDYFDFDIALVLGDLDEEDDEANPPHNLSEKLKTWNLWRNSSNHIREDFYTIAGNHENNIINHEDGIRESSKEDWNMYADQFGLYNATSFVNNEERNYSVENMLTVNNTQQAYTFCTGNVMYVMMSPNLTYPVHAYNYTYAFNWFVSIVENNTDKNIIVSTHHPVYASGLIGDDTDTVDVMFMDWLVANNATHTVNTWWNGHWHYRPTGTRYFLNTSANVTFINPGAIDEIHCGSCNERHSYLFTFSEGYNNVSIADFRHDGDTWDPAGNPGNMTYAFNLSFPFDMDYESETEIGFTSINTQLNNTVIVGVQRNFIWNSSLGATRYQLQIANDSAFTDIWYNKFDINSTNYGSAFYHEAGNNVYFNITNIYNEGARMGDTHYYRIRANTG